jgi:hypothetical protein
MWWFWFILLIFSPLVFIVPCYLFNTCFTADFNLLGALYFLISKVWLIMWYLLYIFGFYNNKEEDNFFYKWTIVISIIYLFILLSFKYWDMIEYFRNYENIWDFFMSFPYLLIYLFLIPLIKIYININDKKLNIKRQTYLIVFLFITIIYYSIGYFWKIYYWL